MLACLLVGRCRAGVPERAAGGGVHDGTVGEGRQGTSGAEEEGRQADRCEFCLFFGKSCARQLDYVVIVYTNKMD